MKFSFDKSLEILQSTPNVISAMLNGLSDEWTTNSWMDGVYFLNVFTQDQTRSLKFIIAK